MGPHIPEYIPLKQSTIRILRMIVDISNTKNIRNTIKRYIVYKYLYLFGSLLLIEVLKTCLYLRNQTNFDAQINQKPFEYSLDPQYEYVSFIFSS
jgi:hypothetical protein